MCFLPPRHMPLPQANSKLCSAELLPTVQHSDGKAQPYTVRHLSQSSAILATAIQLFSFGKRKACMDLYKALFREIQRGKNSLQLFCTNKQQKFLRLFSRFLMWHCVSSLFTSHVRLPKQELCRDMKGAQKAEQVRKELAGD